MPAGNGYVYESFESGLWTVGYYDQDGKFRPESDHKSPAEAADQVNYLNGGKRPAESPSLAEQVAAAMADRNELAHLNSWQAREISRLRALLNEAGIADPGEPQSTAELAAIIDATSGDATAEAKQ